MQEVTGSSPVSPTNHHFHAQTDRITASQCPGPVDYSAPCRITDEVNYARQEVVGAFRDPLVIPPPPQAAPPADTDLSLTLAEALPSFSPTRPGDS